MARTLAYSPIFHRAQKLWAQNQQDWNFPLSKFDKLVVGAHLILSDYAQGHFPPTFTDQQEAYQAEIEYKFSLPGHDSAEVTEAMMRKPFWFGPPLKKYLADFLALADACARLGLRPPQKLLELGCGTGWMAEFLALMQFDMLGTSISPHEIQDAQTRIQSLKSRRLDVKLEFRATPMESVNQAVLDRVPFDAVFVFEALHHAHDWRQAIQASHACLKPGGWLIIASEPNAMHTFISYRVAKLSNTHEVGFTRTELKRQLLRTGFRRPIILKNWLSFYLRPHWIAAQK